MTSVVRHSAYLQAHFLCHSLGKGGKPFLCRRFCLLYWLHIKSSFGCHAFAGHHAGKFVVQVDRGILGIICKQNKKYFRCINMVKDLRFQLFLYCVNIVSFFFLFKYIFIFSMFISLPAIVKVYTSLMIFFWWHRNMAHFKWSPCTTKSPRDLSGLGPGLYSCIVC